MDPFLIELGDKMDQTTKQVLQNLIDRKLTFNRYKNIHFILLSTTILYSFFTFYFIYKTTIIPNNYTFIDLISIFTEQSIFIYLIVIGIALFGSVKISFEKRENSEKDYHNLRCEVIDKIGDLLQGDAWKERHKIFEFMKKKYDINLYHESK